MKYFSFFMLFLYFFNVSGSEEFPRNYFISPVDLHLRLSANFGELRTNAFHAGIDIRTGGVTGKPVRAAAEGFIYRIRVSPVGYGRALYIQHPNGLATVYGHLDEFNEEIEKYVKDEQYKQQDFSVDLRPPNGRIRVEQGDLIGYSGNTGSSFGPHLHFEIREGSTQMPVNPLLFDFRINDNLPPVLYTLAVYPLNHNSLVNGRNKALYLPLTGGNGNYRIANDNGIEVYGDIGFGIQTTDFLNDSPNRCGVWSVELLLDNNSIFRHELTKFAFAELRYINSHIDYSERIKNSRNIQRMFLQSNNLMSIYSNHINKGVISFYNKDEAGVRIIVKDAYKNRSELPFTVKAVPPEDEEMLPPPRPDNFAMLMRYDQENMFSGQDVSLSLPAGAIYEDLLFEFTSSPPVKGSISPVYHIHNEYTPVHRNYNLSISAKDLPEPHREKALIVNIDNSDTPNPVTSKWSDGFMHCRTNVFGRFSVMLDTISPTIEPLNIHPAKNMTSQNKISLRVKDDLSGIKSHAGFIDDEWVLFEFDPKNDHLFYNFDPERIGRDKERKLELYLMDEKDNIAVYTVDFYY